MSNKDAALTILDTSMRCRRCVLNVSIGECDLDVGDHSAEGTVSKKVIQA